MFNFLLTPKSLFKCLLVWSVCVQVLINQVFNVQLLCGLAMFCSNSIGMEQTCSMFTYVEVDMFKSFRFSFRCIKSFLVHIFYVQVALGWDLCNRVVLGSWPGFEKCCRWSAIMFNLSGLCSISSGKCWPEEFKRNKKNLNINKINWT